MGFPFLLLGEVASLFLVFGWAEQPLHAEQTDGSKLSLADAERRALTSNADVQVARANFLGALAQVQAAREFPNPTVGASTSGINTDGRGNGSALHNRFLQRSYDSILSVGQLLELAGKRGLRERSARFGREAAEAAWNDARRLLVQSVAEAYVAALVAREDARILGESTTSLRHEADLASIRVKAGDISTSDQAQIEIAAERFALDAETASRTAQTAVITLEALLGLHEPAGHTQLSDTLSSLPGTDAAPPDAEAAYPKGRPDIVAAEANVAKAEADWRFQERARYPDLTVTGQFEHHPPDQPNSAGVGFSFALPLWNRNRGAILAARAAHDQAVAQLEKTRIEAAVDVASARLSISDASARAAAYRERLVPKSADVLKTVRFAYEKGGASFLDFLTAQRNDNDVRQAASHAQADAAAARASLDAALNRLSPALSAQP